MGGISRNRKRGGIILNKKFTFVSPGEYMRARQIFESGKNVDFVPVVDSEMRLIGEYARYDDQDLIQQLEFFSTIPYLARTLKGLSVILVKPDDRLKNVRKPLCDARNFWRKKARI